VSRIEKQNLANDLAALGLLLARKNRDRHPSVQDFMLANDSCTIACEVPVLHHCRGNRLLQVQGFFRDIAGVAQADYRAHRRGASENGLIHLLDYKPKARHIDPVNHWSSMPWRSPPARGFP